MNVIKNWIRSHEWFAVVILAVVFVLIRLPATDFPLHQDEYKWPMSVNPVLHTSAFIPHPPIGEFVYKNAGYMIGFDTHFRFVPLFFGTLNLFLLYYFVRMRYGRKEAFVAALIWTGSYFSILASLMVDTDGQILPFFFLLSLIAYYKANESLGRKRFLWSLLLVCFATFGFFVKVSFLLAIAAIMLDIVWNKRSVLSPRQWVVYGLSVVGGVLFLGVLLVLSQYVFSFFRLKDSLSYWEHFAVLHRGWFQTAIQCVKALLFASPLLVCVPVFGGLFGSKKHFAKVSVLVFFLISAFLFYVVLFDFSIGALDRYLQLLILPLSVLTAVTLVDVWKQDNPQKKEYVLLGTIAALVLVLTQAFPHYIPPLHPKAEWISRIISLRWNFVYPFSGGSGPLGFYVSFLVIGCSWVLYGLGLLFGLIKPQKIVLIFAFLIPVGIAYNMVFAEEYLVGYWNGNAPQLVLAAVQEMKENPRITMVTTYNDNGGDEIQRIGKYRKRLYIDPKFDLGAKVVNLNTYKEYYFVLDVPRIDPTTVYQKYFDSCKVMYKKVDKKMTSIIYDCSQAPDVQI